MINKNLIKKKYYVEGMHCSSCEILIEKKLIKRDGVEAVDASLANCELDVVLEQGKFIDLNEVNRELEPLGYKIKKNPVVMQTEKLFSTSPSGSLRISKKKLKQLLRYFAIVLSLLVAFFVVEGFQFGRFVSIDSRSTLSAFFLLGLVAGVSSCAALIGGLLLSLIKHWHEVYIDSEKTSQKAQPHILFHVGRLSSFFVLGGALGVVGDAITFGSSATYAFLTVAVSVLMVILALQMLGVSWATKLSPKLPKFITRAAASEQNFKGRFMPFTTGAATFFLPCGFTLIAQGVALSTGDFLSGGLVMFYFALGTLPMLLAISASGIKFTSKPHLTAKFLQVAGIVIIFFALYNINGQLNVLGYRSLSDLNIRDRFKEVNNVKAAPYAGQGDEQIISIVAKGFNYIPTGSTTFQSGRPTKLVVDNQGIQGCGSFMASRGLIDGFIPLERGQNVIDLGSPNPGTYKLTCSMGMVPPVTINIL